jgi:O-antigen/teichoic acid export membrane protein
VTLANIANFGSSFIVGFILPAVLTVAAYGHYREYTLYLSFVYVFNMGFNDGVYIKYGGVDPNKVNRKEVHEEHNFITVFQLLVFLPMIIYGFIIRDYVIVFFSCSTLFITLKTYHQNFSQAVGNFKIFANGNIYKSIFYIGFLLFGVFILRSENYLVYISLSVLSYLLVFLYYEYKFYKIYGFQSNWSLDGKFSLFKVGFFILAANMSLTFIGNVGNWVVNFGFEIEEFAQYSFQNSILNVLLLIVNAVGMVFYNIISKKENKKMLRLTKRICIFLGVFGGLVFFVFKGIIEYVLTNYIASLPLLSVTFIAIPYIMVSKILIANLYKSRQNEMKYFRDSVGFAATALLLVGSTYLLTHNLLAIAFATTICYILWFMYTTRIEYTYLKSSTKELILLASHFVVFYICATNFSMITGFMLYLIYVILVAVAFKKELQGLFQYARKS